MNYLHHVTVRALSAHEGTDRSWMFHRKRYPRLPLTKRQLLRGAQASDSSRVCEQRGCPETVLGTITCRLAILSRARAQRLAPCAERTARHEVRRFESTYCFESLRATFFFLFVSIHHFQSSSPVIASLFTWDHFDPKICADNRHAKRRRTAFTRRIRQHGRTSRPQLCGTLHEVRRGV